MRKLAIAAVVGALVLAVGAWGQNTERQRLAEELLGSMQMQKTIEKSFEAVKQMVPMQMQKMGVSGASEDEAQKVVQQTMDVVMAEMSWDKLKGSYVAIYAETFTADELKGILAFYKSPIGQKLIEKQPEVARRTMQISQQQMMTIMPKIQQIAKQAAAAKAKAEE
jgi:uncharacterized protein